MSPSHLRTLKTMSGMNYIFFSVLYMIVKAEIIDCIAQECKESEDIRCQQTNETCTINCIDDDSCFASHIFCNAHTDCHIFCNGEQSCLKSKINCPTSADCFVNGLNLNSLSQSIIKCPIANATKCQINCDSSLACHNTLIDAQKCEQLHLQCNAVNSCLDFTLYCPEWNIDNNEPNCVISGNDGSEHTNLQIFATNGVKDIDTSQYLSNIGGESVLFCGSNYTHSCLIDGAFNCVNASSECTVTQKPTLNPTLMPTMNPTNAPSVMTTLHRISTTAVYTSLTSEIANELLIYETTKTNTHSTNVSAMTTAVIIEETGEHTSHMYNAPKLVLHGRDAIYLAIFGIIWCILLGIISVCVYLNCDCKKRMEMRKSKRQKPKKKSYDQIIDMNIPPLQ